MSADIHCTLTASVVTTWESVRPTTGKEHHELKVRLDDKEIAGKKIAGRNVCVKSYDREDYLPRLVPGDRVFITGTVQAQSYTAKNGKTSAYNVVYAKIVTREWQRAEPVGQQEAPTLPLGDTRYPQAANAAMRQPTVPNVNALEEDDVPF